MTHAVLRLLLTFWLALAACCLPGTVGARDQAQGNTYTVDSEKGKNSPFSGSTVALAELPREARETYALILRGGPFPYDRDGIEFRNFEKRLPKAARGFYREYTVKTPGERSRGARRIVSGGEPPSVFYYTDDHYNSFRRIHD
ncbi:ribonuclease domain-containing protein [Dechloromonas sp. ZY10]|uniref:ribonuclease domain-containing protein n=1 Tax=Dechloromonas aquae TaxID=2664436 RepID=UPI0035289564